MQQLWDYLDRELSPDQMRAVEGHLTACADCLPHELWGTRFLNALHELREQRVMPPELTERVIQELRAAGFTGGL
ncbi:MAG: anti-sigma factor family protein [Gemmatimonadaceae bacterium]